MKKTTAMRRLIATILWFTKNRSEAVGIDRSAPLPYRGLRSVHHISGIELDRTVILSNEQAQQPGGEHREPPVG